MNTRYIIAYLILLCSASTVHAASAEWKIKDVRVEGPEDFRMLCVETAVTVQCDAEQEITFTTVGSDTLLISYEVRNLQGATLEGMKLEEVLTTGPAPAFIKKTVLKKGERRVFRAFGRPFLITQSGDYSVASYLDIQSVDGKSIGVPLKKINFHVDVPKKEANQQPEPTRMDDCPGCERP